MANRPEYPEPWHLREEAVADAANFLTVREPGRFTVASFPTTFSLIVTRHFHELREFVKGL
jgi:hypothetical protein